MARLETNGGSAGGARQPSPRGNVSAQNTLLQSVDVSYLEHLLAAYEADPSSVGPTWREYFASLGAEAAPAAGGSANGSASGPSWARPGWPATPTDELVVALGGEAPRETELEK
jgi:2-oxoglutarate dehydrogenase E1 component